MGSGGKVKIGEGRRVKARAKGVVRWAKGAGRRA